MRDWLNAIFSIIGAESLTDQEFATITITEQVLTEALYKELAAVVASRDLVTNTTERLTAFFVAKGVSVTPAEKGRSNIYLGAPL